MPSSTHALKDVELYSSALKHKVREDNNLDHIFTIKLYIKQETNTSTIVYQIFWSLINQGNFVSFLKKNGNFVSFTKGTPYTFGIKEHTTSIIT